MRRLQWRSWLPTMRLADCDEAMMSALVESGPDAKAQDYYLTLVRDAPALRARSRLFNAVMYGRRGLARADRELAATAESRMNGCVFCASVHSRLYVQLSRDSLTMERLLEHGPQAEMSARNRAIVNFAIRLGANPPCATADDIAALRGTGLTDDDIADTTRAIAMFAWANRLMLTLGEPEPEAAESQEFLIAPS